MVFATCCHQGSSRHILLNIIPTCVKRLQVVILEFVFHHQESCQFVLSLFGESLPLQVPCNNFFRVCLQSWNPLRNQEKIFQLQMRHEIFKTCRTLDFSDPFQSCSRVSEAFCSSGRLCKKKSSQQMEARRSRPSVQLDLLRFILVLSFSR